MCDTFAIRTREGVYFGKNSDREPNEPQVVVRVPRVSGDETARLSTTYIEIPQVPDRCGVLLSKPSWIWGAEMGINDCGVAIGNEAIFSRLVDKKGKGLIGMDLVRLGLERGRTAESSLSVIVELLEKYGQGGPCGYLDKGFRYDNSFLIADRQEIWVLETAGKNWVAKRYNRMAAISNILTIGSDYDRISPAVDPAARISFRKAYDTKIIPFFAASSKRRGLVLSRLQDMASRGTPGFQDIFALLRLHAAGNSDPRKGSNADVCMHAAGIVRRSQTCGSCAFLLKDGQSVAFFTGTSAPCLSLFKPVSMEPGIGSFFVSKDGGIQSRTLWHSHERVHRKALFDRDLARAIRRSIDSVEEKLVEMVMKSEYGSENNPLEKADQLSLKWHEEWQSRAAQTEIRFPKTPYGFFWKNVCKKDGIGL